ncbi:GyrI-like domain-containing protein [Shewanella waksmanii]|uniref:GyrI-like domain-containing protein n=1 Tax=Shewanella waksmanii TaxID=213783 RepID=UPI003736332D
MELVDLDSQSIIGEVVRTDNEHESQPEQQKIAPLWQRFMAKYAKGTLKGKPVYGVYFDYESNQHGAYSVLAGAALGESESEGLTKLTTANGSYLKFSAQGAMPETVVSLWQHIWQRFDDENCQYQRAFVTDFECYTAVDKVDIYIGIV